MTTPSVASTIFCCDAALPVQDASNFKLHNDPNRELHEAIFHSFLAFAVRRQHSADLLSMIMGIDPTLPASPDEHTPQPAPLCNLEALQSNPLTAQTPYVIHLTSRHDFGPVYSHRYFVCPPDLQKDWVEISLLQWFAAGEPFKMKAEKWDLKCKEDGKFFRLTLRPNLAMRGCYPVSAGETQQMQYEETASIAIPSSAERGSCHPVSVGGTQKLQHEDSRFVASPPRMERGSHPEKLFLPDSVGKVQLEDSASLVGLEHRNLVSKSSLRQREGATAEGLKDREYVWNEGKQWLGS